MRADLGTILDLSQGLRIAIENRMPKAARFLAVQVLRLLPADDFADPAPGLTVCYSRQEWEFRAALPFLRGATAKWLHWLEAPAWLRACRTLGRGGRWPEPVTLRAAVAALEGIAASMTAEPEGESTHQNASVSCKQNPELTS